MKVNARAARSRLLDSSVLSMSMGWITSRAHASHDQALEGDLLAVSPHQAPQPGGCPPRPDVGTVYDDPHFGRLRPGEELAEVLWNDEDQVHVPPRAPRLPDRPGRSRVPLPAAVPAIESAVPRAPSRPTGTLMSRALSACFDTVWNANSAITGNDQERHGAPRRSERRSRSPSTSSFARTTPNGLRMRVHAPGSSMRASRTKASLQALPARFGPEFVRRAAAPRPARQRR